MGEKYDHGGRMMDRDRSPEEIAAESAVSEAAVWIARQPRSEHQSLNASFANAIDGIDYEFYPAIIGRWLKQQGARQ